MFWHCRCCHGIDVYYCGGNFNSLTINSTNVRYSGGVTALAPLPFPARSGHATAGISRKAYSVGGVVPATAGYEDETFQTRDNDEYDIAADSWSNKTDMGVNRRWLCAAGIGGYLQAYGGARLSGASQAAINSNEQYDPSGDSWSTQSTMPTSVMSASFFAIGEDAYAVGGAVYNGSTGLGVPHFTMQNTNFAYSASGGAWSSKASIGSPARSFAVGGGVLGGKGYVFGGAIGDIAEVFFPFRMTGQTRRYDPTADSWSTLNSGSEIACHAYVSDGVDSIHAFGGGITVNNGSSDVRTYAASMDTWSLSTGGINIVASAAAYAA